MNLIDYFINKNLILYQKYYYKKSTFFLLKYYLKNDKNFIIENVNGNILHLVPLKHLIKVLVFDKLFSIIDWEYRDRVRIVLELEGNFINEKLELDYEYLIIDINSLHLSEDMYGNLSLIMERIDPKYRDITMKFRRIDVKVFPKKGNK